MSDSENTPLCGCGCGGHTKIAASGPNRGKANRFIYGHNRSRVFVEEAHLAPGQRTCRVCKEIKPIDQFGIRRDHSTGRTTHCKTCASVRRKEIYRQDPQRFIDLSVKWSKENPEKARRNRRKWAAANPEAWKNADQELARERRRRWDAEHPEVRAEMARRRRARKMTLPTVHMSAELIAERAEVWGGNCWICGDVADTMDHVKPLSKGGPHMLSNLRPACMDCNRRKSGKWPFPSSSRGALAALGGKRI